MSGRIEGGLKEERRRRRTGRLANLIAKTSNRFSRRNAFVLTVLCEVDVCGRQKGESALASTQMKGRANVQASSSEAGAIGPYFS